jgi:uncharacterized membrane protein YfcA
MLFIGISLFLMLLLLGFIVGLPASMCGLGGGFILVPTLIIVFNLPPQNAVAISLVAMCGTTFSAAFGYIRQRRVDYKLALLYDIFDVPGVIIGAYMTTLLPKDLLVGLCGFFILFLSLLLLRNMRASSSSTKNEELNVTAKGWRRRISDTSNKVFEYEIRRPILAMISSLMSGLVTGLAGLGGGITDTTTMILLGIPTHIAVATSEFAMALTNGVGVAAHGILQNITIEYAIPLTIGTIFGAQIGVLVAERTKRKTLRKIISVIAFLPSLRLVLQFFGI